MYAPKPFDDLRYTLLPNAITDFWHFNSSPELQMLKTLIDRERLPRFMILVGPPGCGKSALAYAIGRWASCSAMQGPADNPCGDCEKCRAVRCGGDGWSTSNFDEFSPRSYASNEEAFKELKNKFRYVQRYGRNPGFDGVRPHDLILFVNEAQAMTKSAKGALLTDLEQMSDMRVIAATTDIREMQIEQERAANEDPLISRGKVLRLNYPSIEEAVKGLVRDAPRAGLTVDEDAARRIARMNASVVEPDRCSLRDCLGTLTELSAFGTDIAGSLFDEVYGRSAASGNGAIKAFPADDEDPVY